MSEYKLPLYQRIVNDYKSKIFNGELGPHDPIPTQLELAKLYDTSEITSRRALTELVNEQLVYRIRRKGTFVKDLAQSKKNHLFSNTLDTIYFAHPNAKMRFLSYGFYAKMLNGIQRTCEDNQKQFRIWDLGVNYELPDDDHAGFVMVTDIPGARTNYLEALQKWKIEKRRVVTVQFCYPHLHIPYVIGDNLTGGYLATQHLLSLGHQRIGIILTGKSEIDINQEFSFRLQGYRLALSNYNIDFDPQLVRVIGGPQEDESMGYDGFIDLMALEHPPTAVFATSDIKAIGAMLAARETGFKVPEDVSIIGYDGEEFGEYSTPSLTSVDQNSFQFGRRAAELLLFEWKEDNSLDTLMDLVVPQMIIRNSTLSRDIKNMNQRIKHS